MREEEEKKEKATSELWNKAAAVPLPLRVLSLFPPAASLRAAVTCGERLGTRGEAAGKPPGAGSSTPGFNFSCLLPYVSVSIPFLREVWGFRLAYCLNSFPRILELPQIVTLA